MPEPTAAASAQWEAKSTDAPTLTTVYLMQTGNVFRLDDAGPAEAAFVYNEAQNRVYVDEDPNATGALRIAVSDTNVVSLY